jgi:hypothetical protein
VKNLAIWEPLSFFRLFSKIKIEKNDVEKRLFWNNEKWKRETHEIMPARDLLLVPLCKLTPVGKINYYLANRKFLKKFRRVEIFKKLT